MTLGHQWSRRSAGAALWATTTLSLVNLPSNELPPAWLFAFAIPAAVLGAWSTLGRRPWTRALTAVVLQTAACYAALELVGPMTRPAALACTIVPPLAFFTARNRDLDPSLALFLSFCVLLVGVILGGDVAADFDRLRRRCFLGAAQHDPASSSAGRSRGSLSGTDAAPGRRQRHQFATAREPGRRVRDRSSARGPAVAIARRCPRRR